LLEQHPTLVNERDDLYTEYCSLLNFLGRNEEALSALLSRRFHPWEGGEGKVTGQYVFAQVELGKRYLQEDRLHEAQAALLAAKEYPRSLGEGKLVITQENNIDYWLGRVAYAQGQAKEARDWLRRATEGASELGLALYYNDQPADLLVYQGFAFQALGEPENARSVFNTLVDFGEQHVFDEVKIDYFAVSLPDFLVFDADLNSMNRVLCHYLIGLGKLGLELYAEAEHHLRHVLELDAAHQGARIHLEMVQGGQPEHVAATRAGRSGG
jgi:tetratricopeptide (TPR) repeat protein